MKKILTVFLTLCLLASLAVCFAFSANAEETEVEVTVGQTFEWNDQSGELNKQRTWSRSGGKSPDGLWKYQFYAIQKEIYQDLVLADGNFFAWSTKPGSDDNGIGYARVRNFGKNFHPATNADVVKVFTCPSGGTIQITSTVARQADLVAGGKATGSSFAIYVEDRLVYPEEGNGEYLTLVSTTPQTVDITVDVAKGERVRIHIGAIGEQSSDGVDMTNVITYKSINDNVGELSSDKTVTVTQFDDGKTDVQPPVPANDEKDNDRDLPVKDDGVSVGLIVGIVVAVVAVAGIAVAVVVVLKKKKQE